MAPSEDDEEDDEVVKRIPIPIPIIEHQETEDGALHRIRSPYKESWVHLLDASLDPELEHHLIVGEVFLKDPVPYDDREVVRQWGDAVLNILAITEVRIIMESDHHWRVEVDITTAGGLIAVLQAVILWQIEWVRSFPMESWRTDRLTIIRHTAD